MKSTLLNVASLGVAAAMTFGVSANAQTAAAGSGFGLTATTPGVCLLSSGALIAQSAVGKAVDARLKQLSSQVAAELTPEKTAIETEDRSISAAAKTATTPAQQAPLQARMNALQNRAQAYSTKASQREAEMRATQQKALGEIGSQAQPVIREVAIAHNCSVVMDTTTVVDANPASDITSAAVQALNAKVQTLSFERERLDSSAGGAQIGNPRLA